MKWNHLLNPRGVDEGPHFYGGVPNGGWFLIFLRGCKINVQPKIRVWGFSKILVMTPMRLENLHHWSRFCYRYQNRYHAPKQLWPVDSLFFVQFWKVKLHNKAWIPFLGESFPPGPFNNNRSSRNMHFISFYKFQSTFRSYGFLQLLLI